MGPVSWRVVESLFTIVAVAVVSWVLHRRWKHGLFKRYGIPGPEARSLLFGHWRDLRRDTIKMMDDWIQNYGSLVGIYGGDVPLLLVSDLDAIKDCLVKRAHEFRDRVPLIVNVEPLKSSLLGIKGAEWKMVRSVLNPTFSTAKMRMISRIIDDCTNTTVEILDQQLASSARDVDVSVMAQGLTMDCIAKSVLGWKCEYQRNPQDPFLTSLRETLIGADNPIVSVAVAFPPVRWLIKLVYPYVNYGRFFSLVTDSVREVIKARRLLEYKNREENARAVDMLQLMLDAQYKSHTENVESCSNRPSMTDDHVVSNCFVTLGGGFETTSLTLALLLDELARNPDEQQKLYAEVSSAFQGDVTSEALYDKLQGLKRLEMVINEGLRKYPPLVFFTARMCYQDTELAGKVVPAGTRLIVPTWSIHRNPELWPDPERFDPERFSEGLEKDRHPASYIPFGMGPRECIGKKFAMLELKMALCKLVRRYEFSLSSQSVATLEFKVPLISINPVKNIVLQVKRRGSAL
ncbi:cytochrome P450 3A24 [Dermacentor silvarum]|uniref:cytochrome P450 3A24 n=1 Tax=Dermacentor silvarum TaxID=543639 RepID=UPI0021014134|nr:cytochrome P450 3A24 [Dermacentor silvarum]XP_049516542.1 cytochrome P450 3A24 [Dermacentor silvarum]